MTGPKASPKMDQESEAQAPPDDDRTPTQDETPPAAKPPGEWVMPKPVFRQSSGYDPTVARKAPDPTADEIDTQSPDPTEDETLAESPQIPVDDRSDPPDAVEAPLPSIAEQPDLSGEFSLDEIDGSPPVPARRRSGVLRIMLIILALAAMLVVLFVFLAIVYLLFFFPSNESQNLN